MDKVRTLSLSLEGLDEIEHSVAAEAVQHLCPILRVVQIDNRDLRQIDRVSLQLAVSTVAAACAVIGLCFNLAVQKGTIGEEDVQTLLALIEKKCGSFSEPNRHSLANCALDRADTIELELPGGNYELKVTRMTHLHITGKPLARTTKRK